ncbi:spore coat protein YsxE [Caldibacillus lycopersici]|uniref:Spore coat protein YsxE n=1 Tax=Perspicuibacillus lycopersici TaxID=1325689 RepID=A0AAE3ITD8_9BACI|nr:spore coat protein YsxE [Perspicuibacillus lycopersici]MCU9614032.1 spore coat protein YsxE [Perspicuibacillus lycopersici]
MPKLVVENMYDANEDAIVRDILKEYNLRPSYYEKIGKVFKVYTNENVYALKRMDIQDGNTFFNYLQYLYKKGYYRIVPFYPTKKGHYSVLRNRKLFYLMPWINDENRKDHNEKTKKMIRELARLHAVTAKEVEIQKEMITEHYKQMSLQWKREIDYLDRWMDQCEQTWYKSPFQWEFVQYYDEIRKAYEFSLSALEQWYQKIQNAEKIRTVLIHGKLAPEHFVQDEKGYGYFINLEKSQINSPFRDLLPYLAKQLKTYPSQKEEVIDWILTYMKYYPLREEEKLLFKSYLAQPGNFIHLLEGYQTRRLSNHEMKYTKRLQHAYWMFKNIEYIVMRMEEIEQQRKTSEQ